eukprot:354701-Chlamydomonas_euryale.AAC.3
MGARGLGRSGGRRSAGKRPQQWAAGLQCVCPIHPPGRESVDAGRRLVSPCGFPSSASVALRNLPHPRWPASKAQGQFSLPEGMDAGNVKEPLQQCVGPLNDQSWKCGSPEQPHL